MQPQTSTDKIVEYLQSHPQSSNREIARGIGLGTTAVSSRTSTMASTGMLKRIPMKANGVGPRYAYEVNDLSKPAWKTLSPRINGKINVRGHIPAEPVHAPPPVVPIKPLEDPPAPIEEEPTIEIPRTEPPPTIQETTPQISATLNTLVSSIASVISDAIMAQIHVNLATKTADLAEQVKEDVRTNIDTPTPEALAARVAHAATPPKLRLKSVLIIGLLPAQAGQISQDFSDCFDLRFWKDESMEMLKHACRGADYVISFTSKTGHSAEEMIKSQHVKIIRTPGGMTQLKNKLTSLYCKEK